MDTTELDRTSLENILEPVQADLEELVAISSPSGDRTGAEAALAVCARRLPAGVSLERIPCSSPDHAPDMLARIAGAGSSRILLLGHVDTVVGHPDHRPVEREGDVWRGSGTVDMKGGVALSLGVASWLSEHRHLFGELSVLLVVDEEWRLQPFSHPLRFEGYDACLCFEAGERTSAGAEGVVVQRKAAGTVQVSAHGRAAHAGSHPDAGINALLAVAEAARVAAALHDPAGSEQLSVVPARISSGEAMNVVPAEGQLTVDVRARDDSAFARVLDAIPRAYNGARLDVELLRSWPGMDSRAATAVLLEAASARLGRQIVGVARGGASDASHFAASIPLTIDGLGPRGGHAHSPEEYILRSSLRERLQVAIAICEALTV